MQALRTIVLAGQLTEEVKWRVPCYTYQRKNVVLISRLKDYCALSFVKGALLKDASSLANLPSWAVMTIESDSLDVMPKDGEHDMFLPHMLLSFFCFDDTTPRVRGGAKNV